MNSKLNILGVCFLPEAGACLSKDGKIIKAVNEERLNRIKLWHGIPEQSIGYVLKAGGISMKDVDFIALHCANKG